MPKSKLSNKQRLQAIYDRIPKIECKKLCQEVCGVIPVNRLELKRMQAATDIDLYAHAQHSDKDKSLLFDLQKETCPALVDGMCSVYEVRPLICRLFGAVPEMRCPHGCIPERWLTHEEAMDIFREIKEVK